MDLGSVITAERPLVLVGAGKMGGALLTGWLAGGLPAAAFRVVDPGPPRDSEALLAEQGIVATAATPGETTARVVVLAVKPQSMSEALPALKGLIAPDTLVLSIAAGIKLSTLAAGLGTDVVVRVMPNTPAQIGKGVSVAVGGAGVNAVARELGTALLSAVGIVEWIDDEGLMDAVTAVSGSGPAYVFLLAECLAEAGIEAGLSPDLARRLADATVAGSGALLGLSDEPPATLRRNVTSPGGTTAAALDVLMAPVGLAQLMRRAVAAAKKRSVELG